MGWYVDFVADAPTWQRRVAITVDNTGGSAGTADIVVRIPTTLDSFWDVIDDNGYNIRVTAADGVDDCVYAFDADGGTTPFSSAAITLRSGYIRIDGFSVEADAIHLLWLYYDPTVDAADHSSAVTITSELDGYIEFQGPSARRFVYREQPPNSSRLQDVTQKAVAEEVDIWVRLDPALAKQQRASQDRRDFEEASYSTMSVIDSVGADQTTMYDQTANRFVWVQDRGIGEMWLRMRVKAGTNNTAYTVLPTVVTVAPNAAANEAVTMQTLQPRVGLSVVNTRYT